VRAPGAIFASLDVDVLTVVARPRAVIATGQGRVRTGCCRRRSGVLSARFRPCALRVGPPVSGAVMRERFGSHGPGVLGRPFQGRKLSRQRLKVRRLRSSEEAAPRCRVDGVGECRQLGDLGRGAAAGCCSRGGRRRTAVSSDGGWSGWVVCAPVPSSGTRRTAWTSSLIR
jgi:hypothetical protein